MPFAEAASHPEWDSPHFPAQQTGMVLPGCRADPALALCPWAGGSCSLLAPSWLPWLPPWLTLDSAPGTAQRPAGLLGRRAGLFTIGSAIRSVKEEEEHMVSNVPDPLFHRPGIARPRRLDCSGCGAAGARGVLPREPPSPWAGWEQRKSIPGHQEWTLRPGDGNPRGSSTGRSPRPSLAVVAARPPPALAQWPRSAIPHGYPGCPRGRPASPGPRSAPRAAAR